MDLAEAEIDKILCLTSTEKGAIHEPSPGFIHACVVDVRVVPHMTAAAARGRVTPASPTIR
jgi:hypothetical protein